MFCTQCGANLPNDKFGLCEYCQQQHNRIKAESKDRASEKLKEQTAWTYLLFTGPNAAFSIRRPQIVIFMIAFLLWVPLGFIAAIIWPQFPPLALVFGTGATVFSLVTSMFLVHSFYVLYQGLNHLSWVGLLIICITIRTVIPNIIAVHAVLYSLGISPLLTIIAINQIFQSGAFALAGVSLYLALVAYSSPRHALYLVMGKIFSGLFVLAGSAALMVYL